MTIVELNPQSFSEMIRKPLVLVDFYATWCGPCRNMGKELEKFAVEHPEIAIGKVNIENEENRELTTQYDVSTIPSLFLFRNGDMEKHLSGFFSSRALAEKLGL